MSIKVSVVGASGRMGKLALDLIEAAQDLQLHSALDSKSELSDTSGADVIFDVTRLEVSQSVVSHDLEQQTPVLVGTSGWSSSRLAEIESAVER